jgi:hypothetical protein
MEEVGLREVTNDTGNMLKHHKPLLNMAGHEFGIGWHAVGIAEHSKYIVIPLGVLLVRRDIISKIILSTLATKTAMAHEMMFGCYSLGTLQVLRGCLDPSNQSNIY